MDAMKIAKGKRSQRDTTQSASITATPQTKHKKSERMRNVLGSVSSKYGGGGYIPKQWVVEETGQDSFSVTNRVTSDILADGFLHHKIACKLVKLLNEGYRVNQKSPATLLALNLEFTDLLENAAQQDSEKVRDDLLAKAGDVLQRIDDL